MGKVYDRIDGRLQSFAFEGLPALPARGS